MNFEFSEEQETIRQLAREILEAEAGVERVKQAEAGADWFDETLWQRLAEANLLGIALPEDLGGMGMGFAELCVLLEEIGRVVAPVPALAPLVLGGPAVAEFGSETQKKEWLPALAAGRTLLTTALVDGGSGDVAAPATRARVREGEIALDGGKRSVPAARRAARVLVPATDEDGAVGLFAVEPQAKGVTLTERRTSRGEPLFDLALEGVRVGAEARLGGPDTDGAAVSEWIWQRALVALAALQVGVSERAIQMTADYVRERVQFGVPIGSFQAVQHRCADAFIELQAMRWTMWRAAWLLAEGRPAAREARVAKLWAAEGGARIANACLHLHGGLGSDVDYPIHRYFLWSKSLELCLGGASPQRVGLGRDMARTGPRESA